MAHGRCETPRDERYCVEIYPHPEDIIPARPYRERGNSRATTEHREYSHFPWPLITQIMTMYSSVRRPTLFTALGLCSLECPSAASRCPRTFLCDAKCQQQCSRNCLLAPNATKLSSRSGIKLFSPSRVLVNNGHFTFRTMRLHTQIRKREEPVELFHISWIAETFT